jgi:hypothetical protein
MWPNERKKGGKRKETKEHLFGETKYKANKTPQMWYKKIPRRKTGRMESEDERSTHVRRRFLLPELRLPPSSSSSCVCLCARVGGLAESYLARKKRELLVGCGHFAVCSQMPTAFTLLSDDYGFTKLRGGVCLSTRR